MPVIKALGNTQFVVHDFGQFFTCKEHIASKAVPGLSAEPIVNIKVILYHLDFFLIPKTGVVGFPILSPLVH